MRWYIMKNWMAIEKPFECWNLIIAYLGRKTKGWITLKYNLRSDCPEDSLDADEVFMKTDNTQSINYTFPMPSCIWFW